MREGLLELDVTLRGWPALALQVPLLGLVAALAGMVPLPSGAMSSPKVSFLAGVPAARRMQ